MKQARLRPLCFRLFAAAAFISAGFAFFAGGTASAITVTDGVTAGNGLPALSVQWTDSLGLPRTAVMVKQAASSPNGPIPQGVLYSLTYQTNAASAPVVCAGGSTGYQGEGFIQNHVGDTAADQNNNQDNNIPGTTSVVLQGAGHAIIAFSMPTYYLTITPPNGAPVNVTVPTTIYWFFADGRSHPIFAISQDARGVDPSTLANLGGLAADSRTPYGSLNFDGSGNTMVGGASYGDNYQFVTLASSPEVATTGTGWVDTAPNTIPYAMAWAEPPTPGNNFAGADAEMGHVATLPITLQDQGSDPKDSSFPDPRGASDTTMLQDGSWAFQILDYTLDYADNGGADGIPVAFSKLAWGGNYGRVGGFNNNYGYGDDGLDPTQYSEHYDSQLGQGPWPNTSQPFSGSRAPGLLSAYSVFIVLGPHSSSYPAFFNGAVGQEVAQMENAAQATLSASVGVPALSGPAGVGGATSATIPYSPSGYNPTYAAWEIAAAANAVNATLTPAPNQPLDHPMFLVDGYTSSQLPTAIYVGDGLSKPNVDYFATLDTAHQQLWITVNRAVTNALNLILDTPTARPSISSIPSFGYFDGSITITGANFSGATAVDFQGTNSLGFTVDSPTQITARIPFLLVGTGTITVTTPLGSATSSTSIALELFYWHPVLLPNYLWKYFQAELNGNKLVAINSSGRIYTSANAGVTWLPTTAPIENWRAVASSSDGQKLVAPFETVPGGGLGGGIYISSDGGAKWGLSGAPTNLGWISVAISTNGTKLAAIGNREINGDLIYSIYNSTDSGATWTEDAVRSFPWTQIVSSADGSKLALIASSGLLYTSTNSGGAWTATTAPSLPWVSLASSADGARLLAASGGNSPGQVYASSDGGANWTLTTAPKLNWTGITISADGTQWAGVALDPATLLGTVYTAPSGGSWNPTGIPAGQWSALSFAGTGDQLIALGGSEVYTASLTPGSPSGGSGPPAGPAGGTTTQSYTNTFPTAGATKPFTGGSVASWVYWYGLNYNNTLMTNDPSMDAQGNTNSGSLKVYLPFGSAGDQGVFFGTFDNQSPYDGALTVDGSYVQSLAFDIHFAPGTPLNSAGNLGSITMSIFPGAENGGDFGLFPSVTIPASATSGWFHATETVTNFIAQEPFSGLTNCDAMGFNYNSYSGYPTNPVTFWIDNVTVISGEAQLPTAVTWPAPSSIVYGTALGAAQLDAAASAPGTFVYSPPLGAVLGVSTGQVLSVTFLPTDSIHVQSVTTNVLLQVTPAPLTVTANNASRALGAPNPSFTASFSGFVNGDTASVVAGQASFTTTATSASPVGTYSIAPGAGSLKAANYTFVKFVNGTLTVTPAVTPPSGLTWAPVFIPLYYWDALAASADGTKLFAAASGGEIYLSTNSGAAWTPTSAPLETWTALASSADGVKVAAAANIEPLGGAISGAIYTSSNAGASWTLSGAPTNIGWFSIASSTNGTKLAAVGLASNSVSKVVYTSADSGSTWTSNNLPAESWAAVASSADGTKLAVAADAGQIFISTNAGASWQDSGSPTNNWAALASSANGAVLVAAAGIGSPGREIYVSTDGGASWSLSSAPAVVWEAVASSPDGSQLIAVSRPLGGFPGSVYTSANSGATWTSNSLPNAGWTRVASSVNGTELVVADGSGIYVSPASLIPAAPVPAEIWTSNNVPSEQWVSVASSADGTNLAAVGMNPFSLLSVVDTSTDAGAVWTMDTAPTGPYSLTAVASSSDGTKLAAGSTFSPILISTNGGTTWVPTSSPSLGWHSVACSSNGTELVAAGYGALYTSADGGATWTSNNVPPADWTSVASSANGTSLVAVGTLEAGGAGVIYTSANAGTTWSLSAAPNESWTAAASSADGTKLAAGANGAPIYVSADAGATWTATPSLLYDWTSVASSVDGRSLVAGSGNGQLFTSTNSGATWTLTGAPVAPWASVASSADGSRAVAVSGSGEVYTLQTAPLPPAKALPAVAWAASSPIVYGTVLSSAQLDATANVPGTFFYSPGLGANLGAGANQLLTVTFTPTDTADYQTVTTNVLLNVSPAPLTVTANSASRAVGQTNPVFTVSFSGFVNGDSSSAVSGQAAITTSATTASPAGTYPIVPGAGTLSAANYTFAQFVNGAVTVTPVPTWAPVNVPLYSWDAVAASTNGAFLVAAAASGEVFVSTNSGASWTNTAAPFVTWTALACSSDGTRLAAASTGAIYTSSNGGAAWTLTSAPTNLDWFAVASSADGTKLVAAGTTTNPSVSLIYRSTDSGATWQSNSLPNAAWTAVASSADGTRLVASAASGQIFISTNTGASWSATTAPVEGWISVACAANGVDLVAATQLSGVGLNGRQVFTSSNSGNTWFQTSAPTLDWSHVFSSPDGIELVAVSRPLGGLPGAIYSSPDEGATWNSNNVPSVFWSSAALPANDAELVAVGGDQIYITPSSLIPPAPVPAETWISNSVPNIPGVQWAAVASSASGTNLVAVGMNIGSIFPVVDASTNAGGSWTLDASFPTVFPISSYLLTAVASSADGTRLAVGTRMGTIYTSADAGVTWTASGAPTNNTSWAAVASSADGTKLAAASVWPAAGGGSTGQIYTSADAGVTWTSNNAPSAAWTSIASSADGTRFAAVGMNQASGLGVYATSTNGGGTWSSNSPPSGEVWLSIASSADGAKLVAGSANGPIYTSADSGATWTATASFLYQWTSVASSSDGSTLVAASGNGQLFISTNSGATWTLTGAPVADWLSVALSSDGSRMVAAPAAGPLYTLQIIPPQPVAPPSVGIIWSGSGGLLISWPSAPAGFVLQQNSDLSTTNWVNVLPTPNDNGVTKSILITPQPGILFYRLFQ